MMMQTHRYVVEITPTVGFADRAAAGGQSVDTFLASDYFAEGVAELLAGKQERDATVVVRYGGVRSPAFAGD